MFYKEFDIEVCLGVSHSFIRYRINDCLVLEVSWQNVHCFKFAGIGFQIVE